MATSRRNFSRRLNKWGEGNFDPPPGQRLTRRVPRAKGSRGFSIDRHCRARAPVRARLMVVALSRMHAPVRAPCWYVRAVILVRGAAGTPLGFLYSVTRCCESVALSACMHGCVVVSSGVVVACTDSTVLFQSTMSRCVEEYARTYVAKAMCICTYMY